ncbi:hypothetical protein DFA_06223 [Cavenderia fasciculata]|uniref:Uncharacterized protein n=1 Tax=Cavenderia fasciculata TaxID=261658 RepID=F4PKG0_CACFS|nr:uncharacterized protein DFA_06223 [Cavenderia fasciculata]EGG24084.1 hypothetical protein DFA_06223 [Cavenderia fasciculata]|eukprot:XP_004361935.1 hypothetical protein DFA_06223 [Cavenderia fasciculata]
MNQQLAIVGNIHKRFNTFNNVCPICGVSYKNRKAMFTAHLVHCSYTLIKEMNQESLLMQLINQDNSSSASSSSSSSTDIYLQKKRKRDQDDNQENMEQEDEDEESNDRAVVKVPYNHDDDDDDDENDQMTIEYFESRMNAQHCLGVYCKKDMSLETDHHLSISVGSQVFGLCTIGTHGHGKEKETLMAIENLVEWAIEDWDASGGSQVTVTCGEGLPTVVVAGVNKELCCKKTSKCVPITIHFPILGKEYQGHSFNIRFCQPKCLITAIQDTKTMLKWRSMLDDKLELDDENNNNQNNNNNNELIISNNCKKKKGRGRPKGAKDKTKRKSKLQEQDGVE